DEGTRALRSGCDVGVALACLGLGDWLADQEGREAESEATFNKAIAAGCLHAYVSLGLLLMNLPGREADSERALRTVNATIPLADYVLWALLRSQPGRERDARQALERAANAGVAEAQHELRDDDSNAASVKHGVSTPETT